MLKVCPKTKFQVFVRLSITYTSFLKLKWQDRVTGRGAEYLALAFFCILN